MKGVYDQISRDCSRNILSNYSTSFSMGTMIFPSKTRCAISSIYGYVRLADEIVDTFKDFPQSELMAEFNRDTWLAIERRISTNPVLNAFQEVVHQYAIKRSHINAFLRSMETDLDIGDHNNETYDDYIYGSAEVVGLMCLHVFVKGDQAAYDKLSESARKLGSAFQKINFLRDIREDNLDLNRQYFPDLQKGDRINESVKRQIEEEIKEEFELAYEGVLQLPGRIRLAVWVAFVYYRGLLAKIKRVNSQELMDQRIRISNPQKFYLLFLTTIRYYLDLK